MIQGGHSIRAQWVVSLFVFSSLSYLVLSTERNRNVTLSSWLPRPLLQPVSFSTSAGGVLCLSKSFEMFWSTVAIALWSNGASLWLLFISSWLHGLNILHHRVFGLPPGLPTLVIWLLKNYCGKFADYEFTLQSLICSTSCRDSPRVMRKSTAFPMCFMIPWHAIGQLVTSEGVL